MLKITVTASGPRGCGKSTHLAALRNLLTQHGYTILWTGHPDVEGFVCTHPSSERPPPKPDACGCGAPFHRDPAHPHIRLCEVCLAEWHKQDEGFRKTQDAEEEGCPDD